MGKFIPELALPVVVIDSVAVEGDDPDRVSDEGVIVQVVPVGQMLATIRFTVPVKPFNGVTVSVELPDCPGAGMEIVVGLAEMPKSVTVMELGAALDGR